MRVLFTLLFLAAAAQAGPIEFDTSVVEVRSNEDLVVLIDVEHPGPGALPIGSWYVAVEAAGSFFFLPNYTEVATALALSFDLPAGTTLQGVEIARLPVVIDGADLSLTWYSATLDGNGDLLGELSVWPVTLKAAAATPTPVPTETPTAAPTMTSSPSPTAGPTGTPTFAVPEDNLIVPAMCEVMDAQNAYRMLNAADASVGQLNDTFGALQELGAAVDSQGQPLLESNIASGSRDGYTFSLEIGGATRNPNGSLSYHAWSAAAWPMDFSAGTNSYYVDESGAVRAGDIGGSIGALRSLPVVSTCPNAMSWIDFYRPGAIAAMRTLETAQSDFYQLGVPTFARTFAALGPTNGAGLISELLEQGVTSGYTFAMGTGQWATDGTFGAWSASAWPVSYGSTGWDSFYVDDSGIVRGGAAGGILGTWELPDLQVP